MRRFALYAVGLVLASALMLSYATTSRARGSGPVSHTCSVTDRAFIVTAGTNLTAIGLWGQQYLDGETAAADVASEAANAAKIVGATAPTDPSLAETRSLLVGMFSEYRQAMQAEATHHDAGRHMFHAYGLANFAHDVLAEVEPALAKRGCDVAPLM